MVKKSILKWGVYTLCFSLTTFLIVINLLNPAEPVFSKLFLFKVIAFFALPLFLKYTFFLILAPWYRVVTRLRLSRHYRPDYTPRVSVIIPAWNEEVGIVHTIRSVVQSDYRNLEIVVVNDGSTDGTDGKVRKFLEVYNEETGGPPVLYLDKKNGGKASALNEGIKRSTGEIIITIDADSMVSRDTVSRFVPYFHNPAVMSVAGNIKVANTKRILGIVQHLEFLVTFYLKKVESMFNCVYIVGGAAAAYRREVFTQVGMFNSASITEDIEMSLKILKNGGQILYAEDALVYTEGAETFSGLLQQRVRWKRGRYHAFNTFRELFFNRRYNKFLTFFILPFSVLSDIKLLFESVFLALLLIYSIYALNFSVFLMGALISSTIFLVKSLFFRNKSRLNLIPFIFIGWLLFYIAAFVEHLALMKTLWVILNKQTTRWQVWQRKGIMED